MKALSIRLLEMIIREAKKKGMGQKALAKKAGITQETLSRAKKAADMQLSTLTRLAEAVGLKLTLSPSAPVLEKILSGNLFNEY